jgi:hypothetical protein
MGLRRGSGSILKKAYKVVVVFQFFIKKLTQPLLLALTTQLPSFISTINFIPNVVL